MRTRHQNIVTLQDIQLFNKLNSNIRMRDEYKQSPSPSHIPILSSNSSTMAASSNNMDSEDSSSIHFQAELENHSLRNNNISKKNICCQYLWPFLPNSRLTYENPKRRRQVTRKLQLDIVPTTKTGMTTCLASNIAVILRIFIVFILFCLLFSSNSFVADNDGEGLSTHVTLFCRHSPPIMDSMDITIEDCTMKIGNIECTTNNISHLQLLLELHNVTFHARSRALLPIMDVIA